MVSDLKNRMNDGSEVKLVKKNQYKSQKKFPWSIVFLVLLSISVGVVTSVNYLNLFGEDENTAQISRQNIKRDPSSSVVINMIPDDKKINIAQMSPLSPVSTIEKKASLQEIKNIKDKPPVKEEVVVVSKTEPKIDKSSNIVKKKVNEPKIVVAKIENKPAVVKTEPAKKLIKTPVKVNKAEKNNADEKKSKKQPVDERKNTVVANKDKLEAKPINKKKLVKKPEIPVEVKPKVPPKKDVAKIIAAPVVDRNTFNKTQIPLTNIELAETIYQRGIVLLEEGEVDRASALFVKTLREHPAHLKATEALVGVYSSEQNWQKAIEALKSGIKANKKNISLTMWLAQIYLQQEGVADALRLLKSNQKFAKGNGEYFALLAVIHQNLEQYDLALESYQKALKINNSSSRWWFGMAVVLELQNNLADAQVSYTQALKTGQLPEELVTYAEQRLEYVASQNELSAIP